MITTINNVNRGDIIKSSGGKGIEVKKVELNACSSRGVHINDKYCWDSEAPVSVTRPSAEASISDMEIDEIIGFIPENSPFTNKALFDHLERQVVGSQ